MEHGTNEHEFCIATRIRTFLTFYTSVTQISLLTMYSYSAAPVVRCERFLFGN